MQRGPAIPIARQLPRPTALDDQRRALRRQFGKMIFHLRCHPIYLGKDQRAVGMAAEDDPSISDGRLRSMRSLSLE